MDSNFGTYVGELFYAVFVDVDDMFYILKKYRDYENGITPKWSYTIFFEIISPTPACAMKFSVVKY